MTRTAEHAAGLSVVTDETRGQAINRRRLHHGIKSIHEFAKQTGVSREAITAAEKGEASEGTYARLEAWLDRFEEEIGYDAPPMAPAASEVIEFRISGNFGVDVVVKGPPSHLAELEAAVEKLVRAAQADPQQGRE